MLLRNTLGFWYTMLRIHWVVSTMLRNTLDCWYIVEDYVSFLV